MALQAWLLFCLTETVLCITPGPAVLTVFSVSMTSGRASGLRAALGVLGANLLYFSLAATGVATIIHTSYEMFTAIKWFGAAYLVWIGIGMIRETFWRANHDHDPDATTARPSPSSRHAFRHGFITQATNPKSLIFFTAILPQFVDLGASMTQQMAILGASSIAIEFMVLFMYLSLANRARTSLRPRLRLWLDRLGGGLLIAAGAGLARIRHEAN